MSVNLKKGEKVSLSKEVKNGKLKKVIIGLGWDKIKPNAKLTEKKGFFSQFKNMFTLENMISHDVDCDSTVFLLTDGKIINDHDVIFYGNLRHKSLAVRHCGDNLVGGVGVGRGDDEQIIVDLEHIPKAFDRLVVVINIFSAAQRHHHFGMVENAYARIVDHNTNIELCRYNLTDDYFGRTAMICGELYRKDDNWEFRAIGEGTNDINIRQIAERYK